MKKYAVLFGVALVVAGIALSLGALALAQNATDSQPGDSAPASQMPGAILSSDDSNPSDLPEVYIPERYQVKPSDAASASAVTQAATVYFTPQDENTSTTVIFLYNTGTTTATVQLQTYRLNGTQFINTSVNVPPAGLVRICADTVSTISSTWQDVVVVNFTTSSTYAKMTMPAGVKADGYVVWNNGANYDPLQVAPTLPLRFSIDPPTVFLPHLQRN